MDGITDEHAAAERAPDLAEIAAAVRVLPGRPTIHLGVSAEAVAMLLAAGGARHRSYYDGSALARATGQWAIDSATLVVDGVRFVAQGDAVEVNP